VGATERKQWCQWITGGALLEDVQLMAGRCIFGVNHQPAGRSLFDHNHRSDLSSNHFAVDACARRGSLESNLLAAWLELQHQLSYATNSEERRHLRQRLLGANLLGLAAYGASGATPSLDRCSPAPSAGSGSCLRQVRHRWRPASATLLANHPDGHLSPWTGALRTTGMFDFVFR
jgi:hypothetical protein